MSCNQCAAHRNAVIKKRKNVNKEILAERNKRWREANRSYIIKKNLEYYQANQEKIVQKAAEYRQENKEYLKGFKRRYHIEHKDKICEKKKIYHQQHVWQTACAHSRATDKKYKRLDERCFITPEFLEGIFVGQSRKCYYCDTEMNIECGLVDNRDRATVERKSNDFGHVKHNVVIACLGCNVERKDRYTFREFLHMKTHYKFRCEEALEFVPQML